MIKRRQERAAIGDTLLFKPHSFSRTLLVGLSVGELLLLLVLRLVHGPLYCKQKSDFLARRPPLTTNFRKHIVGISAFMAKI